MRRIVEAQAHPALVGGPFLDAFSSARRLGHPPTPAGFTVRNRRKINALAEKLVSCALAGEGWAFKEIGDRLEGKWSSPQVMRMLERLIPFGVGVEVSEAA